MRNITKSEPVAVTVAIVTVVQTGLALAVAFGADLTEAQSVAVLAFTGALLTLGGVLFARPRVWTQQSVDSLQATTDSDHTPIP